MVRQLSGVDDCESPSLQQLPEQPGNLLECKVLRFLRGMLWCEGLDHHPTKSHPVGTSNACHPLRGIKSRLTMTQKKTQYSLSLSSSFLVVGVGMRR